MSTREDKEKFRVLKQAVQLTGPLRPYTSTKAKLAISRLERQGFDPDLAFSMVEASLPEEEFYDLTQAFPTTEEE